MGSSIRTGAQAFFEDVWSPARQSKSAGSARLSTASVRTYGWQWKSWCDFLCEAGVRWDRARPEHVLQFLATLQGSKIERCGQPARRPASGVTRLRYARALDEIYSVALIGGHVPANPVPSHAALAQDGESLVLPPQDWKTLVNAVRLPTQASWMASRDAAMLLVMLQAGLTVSEVQRLDLGDAVNPHARTAAALADWRQAALPGFAGAPRLSVRASVAPDATRRAATRAKSQVRQVPLEPRAAAALADWMRVRLALPGVPVEHDSPLFCSRKGYGRLTAKSLFLLANQHIVTTLGPKYAREGRTLPHAGPSTLRNSCIARWLHRLDEDLVVKLAGVQDSAALARLRVTPPARPAPTKGKAT